MERVDDVRVVEVGGRGLIGDVHGVRQRQVPHGESLELGVARLDAALVLVVDLRQAGRELAGAGAGGRHHDERAGGLDVLVLAVALVGDDEVDVVGVALDGVVQLAGDAEVGQAVAERVGGALARVLRYDDGRDLHPV